MKKLLHFCNTVVLVFVLAVFLLIRLVPADLREQHPLPDSLKFYEVGLYKAGQTMYELAQSILTHDKVFWVAIALFLANGLYWSMALLFSKKNRDRISLGVSGGQVSITVRALEESLRRSLRGDPQIKDSRVLVHSTGKRIVVTAYVTLLETENLHHLDERIINHLRQHFERIFPAQEPVSYEVVINKLKQVGTPLPLQSARDEPLPPPPPPPPVEQPTYPDSQDD